MSARDLLHSLLADGFTLDVIDGGALLVSPASRITAELRQSLRAYKPELLALLAGPEPADAEDDVAVGQPGALGQPDDEGQREAFDERAAIMEFDGSLSRAEAEPAALVLMAEARPRPRATAPAPTVIKRCAACQHHGLRNNCTVPVAADLLTHAEGFGIVWPAPSHAATCPSFSSKAPTKPVERPYRLTLAQGDAAHAEAWDGATIARFQTRVHRLALLGFSAGDAEDLAEGQHLRDVQVDDRVLCVMCSHYRPGRCCNHPAAGLLSAEVGGDWATAPQQCAGFKEKTL
jgi:hypothetical protein